MKKETRDKIEAHKQNRPRLYAEQLQKRSAVLAQLDAQPLILTEVQVLLYTNLKSHGKA